MTEAGFIEQYSAVWKALEDALRAPAKDWESIEARMDLYRRVSTHLSYAETYFGHGSLCDYLSRLTSQAHTVIYLHTDPRSVRAFFSRLLPRAIREHAAFILVSACVFLGAMTLSFVVSVQRPELAVAFLPEQFKDAAGHAGNENSAPQDSLDSPIMSNAIMINNIRVSVLAFGLGLTLGIGTVYILLFNGFMLGGLAAVYAVRGSSLLFWSLILPHGVWELSAIFIAGGMGLRLGYGLLRPGRFRRVDALLGAARASLPLMAVVTLLLAAAAVIEGFFTPSAASPAAKLLFSAFTCVPLLLYAAFCLKARD